jgi:hypothetical protein
MGRETKILFEQNCTKKLHHITLNKPELRAGVYVLRLSVNGRKVDAKRLLLK